MENNMQNQIPNGWQKERLINITDAIFSGGTPDTRRADYWNGNLKWLSSGETRNKFIYDTEQKITKDGVNNSSTSLGRAGDVVIASAGQGNTRGQTSFLKTDTYINQSIIDIRTKPSRLNNLFLFYNLSNRYSELRSISDSTSIRGSLTTKIFKELEILFPLEVKVQQKIANLLSSFDDKIELNNKIAKNLEQTAQEIFKEWFGKFKFPGYEKVNMVDSELGKIPDGWKIETLDNFCEVIYGKDLPVKELQSSGNPVYGGNGIIGFSDKYIYDDPEIIIGCRGAYSGNIFKTKPKSYVTHNSLVLMRKDSVKLNYLFYALQKANVKSTITGSAQPQITVTELNKLALLKPVEKILNLFDTTIEPIETKLLEIELENQKLAQMRDLLLPKLMKGEVRV